MSLEVGVEPEVVVMAHLFGGEGEGRIEVSEQAVEGVDGNLPDAEEAEDVVYAVGVEVFGHFAEAGFPPGETVFSHLLPVVGR